MRQTIEVSIDLSTTFLWAAVAFLGVKFMFDVVQDEEVGLHL